MEISLEDVRHALVELGRLRFGEMGVEEAIREIVATTHSMFAVDGAGLMLTDTAHHLRSVAASDDRFAHLEELQVRHQEGPCIEAFDTKELVGATDLEQDGRWPLFSEAAVGRTAVRARRPAAGSAELTTGDRAGQGCPDGQAGHFGACRVRAAQVEGQG